MRFKLHTLLHYTEKSSTFPSTDTASLPVTSIIQDMDDKFARAQYDYAYEFTLKLKLKRMLAALLWNKPTPGALNSLRAKTLSEMIPKEGDE